MTGSFIVLEGPDGSGTTTHLKLLSERMQGEGRQILATAEPTGGVIGSWIRTVLKGGSTLPSSAVQLMFCADRADHIENVIVPAMQKGETVLSDRYWHSTVAYGEALGLDAAWLTQVNAGFLQPSITIFLLPSLDICMERMGSRDNAEIYETRQLQEKVHAAYHRLAAENPSIRVINNLGTKDETAEQIWKVVNV